MSQSVASFSISVERIAGYEFVVRFDKRHFEDLHLDEPAPLGSDSAPNASRLLAAAIGNCLSASLLFCMSKAKVELLGLSCDVRTELVRNENKRLRIGRVGVTLRPRLADGASLDVCRDTFEDFCVVTQSVRDGIEVDVAIEPTQDVADAPITLRSSPRVFAG